MGTVNQHQNQHDGQRNYKHSNERNRDVARSNTEKHRYQDHEEELTNDANYSLDSNEPEKEMDFRDKNNNLEDESEN